MGMTDSAIEQSRIAAQLDPANSNAFYNLGVGLRNKGSLPEAIAAFEAVLRLRPNSAEAHTNLALVLMRAGRVAESLPHSETAMRLNPNLIDARYNLACGYSISGRLADAVPLFLDTARALARQRGGVAEPGHHTPAARPESGGGRGLSESFSARSETTASRTSTSATCCSTRGTSPRPRIIFRPRCA